MFKMDKVDQFFLMLSFKNDPIRTKIKRCFCLMGKDEPMRLKRFVISLLAFVLAITLCACGTKGNGTGDSESDIPEKEIVLFGGANDYRIVYPESANSQVKGRLSQLIDAVKAVTGKSPDYATDTSKSKTEIPCEIVLGVTRREASRTALESMPTRGYEVKFIGEKIVITASNDTLLEKAVTAFIGAWKVNGGAITVSNKTVLTYDASDSMRSLYNNGAFDCTIIVPLKCTDRLYDDAVYLAQNLSSATGANVNIKYDEKTDEVEGAFEICLGKTTRTISTELYGSLDNSFEYKILSSGNRIAVGALQDSVVSDAVRQLYSDLYNEIRYAYTGTPVIDKSYGGSFTISEVAASLPTLMAGDFYGIYQSSDDKYVIYTENVTEKDFDDYVALIKNDGAKLLKEYSFENNKYALLEGEKYSTYVSYLPTDGAIRTYVGPTGASHPLQTEATEANEATPALWQLEVDTAGSSSSGGMSYVLRLTDGTFIVVDGGYNTAREAENLYKLLRENTPADKVPTISGWFITHLHSDHFGALIPFATSYANVTDIKAFYYNFPTVWEGGGSNDIDTGAVKNITAAMKKWKTAERYDALHSGMTIGFAGATVDVLCTHEDVYPMAFSDGNDTCTVFGVTIGGQRILFLGDARDGQSVAMLNTIPVSLLKADIVQFSHHGYEGCSEAFYKTVGASVVLWPMNIIGKKDGANVPMFKTWYLNDNPANRYVRTSETVKKIIISGEGTQKFDLPYTPIGARIADYDAIYNERLSKQ